MVNNILSVYTMYRHLEYIALNHQIAFHLFGSNQY